MPLGLRPIASTAISTLLKGTATQTLELTLRFASQSFTTRSTDTPAHTIIDGRINGGLSIDRRITGGEGGQFGALIETSASEIEINNTDGALSGMAGSLFADGREIRVKIGKTEIDEFGYEDVKAYATFTTVYAATAGDLAFPHDAVRLTLAEGVRERQPAVGGPRQGLSRFHDRLQVSVYGGTGGSDGTSDIAGLSRPALFGRCFNVTGQVVDPTIGTVQLHSGEISAVIAAYDGGIELTFDGDHPTYDALAATSLAEDEYASCLAEGYIRFGALVGTPTADVDGAIDGVNGTHSSRHASIMRTILRDYAGILDTELDDSFDDLNDLVTGRIGIFFPGGDQSTVEEAIQRIALSCGAVVGQDGSGLIRTFRLDPPGASSDWRFDNRSILEIERERLPYGVPWKAWGVGYERNWTVQTGGDLATNVSQARRQFLQSDYRYVYAQDADIALAHRTSSSAPLLPSLFVNAEDATAEAERRLSLYAKGRALYRAAVKSPAALFQIRIGETVRLSYARWDLTNGKNFIVVGVADDVIDGRTTLALFG